MFPNDRLHLIYWFADSERSFATADRQSHKAAPEFGPISIVVIDFDHLGSNACISSASSLRI